MSQERLGKSRRRVDSIRRAGSTETGNVSNDPLFSDDLIFQEEAILPSEDSELVRQGRSAAWRSGVLREAQADFLSEYLLGCWLSPDRSNLALTCTCGTNRARSFLRQERRWQQRVRLLEPGEFQALVDQEKHMPLVSSAQLVKGSQRSSPEDVLFFRELQKCFEQALSELSVLQRRVLHLRWVDDLAFDAIGLQTGQSSVAARMAFSRGQRRLLAVLVASDFPCSDACDYLSALDQESPG